MTTTHRILMVLRYLMVRGATVKELAAVVGRDPKTIRRDLTSIRNAGFRLRETIEPRGRKRWHVTIK